MSRSAKIQEGLVWVLAFGIAGVLFVGWDAQIIHTASGDDATTYTLHAVFRQGLRFGLDAICPCGPLAIVYFPQFHPDTFWFSIAGQLLLGAAIAFALAFVAVTRLSSVFTCVFFVSGSAAFLTLALDARYFYVLFMALALLPDDRILAKIGVRLLLMPAVALAFLVKGTFIPAALVVLGVAITVEILQRKPPWASASLMLSTVFLNAAAGQEVTYLFSYVYQTLQNAAGYAERFSESGPLWELGAFLVLALGTWLIVTIAELRRNRTDGFLYSVGFGALLFLLFKTSFVRQDGQHVIRAFCAVIPFLIAYVFLNIDRLRFLDGRRAILAGSLPFRRWWGIALAITGILVVAFGARYPSLYVGKTAKVAARVLALHGVLTNGRDYFLWAHELALAGTRAQYPLPRLEQAVTVYSSLQTPAVAHGFQLRPLPSIAPDLSMSASTEAENFDFLASPAGPVHVVMRDISFARNLAARAIIENYEVRDRTEDFLVLTRRERRPLVETSLGKKSIIWNVDLVLPADAMPLWARISYKSTLLGRLVGLLYKPPPVYLVVNDDKGEVYRLRANEGLLEQGILLLPALLSFDEFGALLGGSPSALPENRRSLRLLAGEPAHGPFADWLAAHSFFPAIDIELYRLDFASATSRE